MPEHIKVILFDLGGVLVDFDYTIAAKRIINFCNKTPQEIFKLFFDSNITVLFEEGKITPMDFFIKIKEGLDLRLSYECFVPIWNEIFFLSAKNRAVYSIVNNLKSEYKIAMITNTNILHYEYLKKNFPVFNVFHKVFTSCELGVAKPNSLIYQNALEELGVSAESAFYTDDRLDLVKSAQALGIKAFVFRDAKQLEKDLAMEGIIFN
ncbi:MAG: HAD family phosphatase [Candidatus Omnitrophica bacterium]|nr:HAD family phosphatase [Candidatus Omnitrophota bacterium]